MNGNLVFSLDFSKLTRSLYKLTGFLFYFNDLALSMHSTGSQFDHDHAPILMETTAIFFLIKNSWRNGLDADPLRQLFII